jgi:hypothetical protein
MYNSFMIKALCYVILLKVFVNMKILKDEKLFAKEKISVSRSFNLKIPPT